MLNDILQSREKILRGRLLKREGVFIVHREHFLGEAELLWRRGPTLNFT